MIKTFTITVDFPDNSNGRRHDSSDLKEYVINAVEGYAMECGGNRCFNYNCPEVTKISMRDEQ
jgi:hypothetical protein